MAKQKQKHQKRRLSRMLAYVLGHRPDEFGLFPDENGFIPLKELLMALQEEEGWSFVRESHITDLIREPEETRLELKDKMIRVRLEDTGLEIGPFPAVLPPKVLYHAARRKGYPSILEHGLKPIGGHPYAALFETREMALRVGHRRDPDPVLLTIQADLAVKQGIVFHRPQESIYLVENMDPAFVSGPPLPKEKEPPEKKKQAPPPAEPPTPGSFILEPDRGPRPERRKKSKDWKRARRKMGQKRY